ncbi:esterase B1-like [Eurosta solidaginis]|uniref:esterase B1-like n=1 Tax=Eurosta solidaginis TaxID=178769 RepID=UPI00353102CE
MALLSFMERLKWHVNVLGYKITQYRLSTNETVLADTEYGQVSGLKRRTLYDVPFYSFEGIPYAKPPMGDLRFKAPELPVPWTAVLDCYYMKDKATQMSLATGKVEGSEDCLYLSVYTKNIKPEKPTPVMIWIHGGGFIFGEANRDWYGPDYFMEKDVILVTVQYRVGVFGFLNLSSPELNVPGNAGLKDQILALKWIKKNISNFGGDPNCITVFGQSAGGASVHYLCITEQTRGLFHRAICQSGVALADWANNEYEQLGYHLAKLAGYKAEDDEKQVLEFLMNANPAVLAASEKTLLYTMKTQHKLLCPFVPCVEKYETPQCVISKSPRKLMKTAWSNQIPILMGCTSKEGLLMASNVKSNPQVLQELKTCRNFVPNELLDGEYVDEIAGKLKQIHASNNNPSAEDYLDIKGYELFYFPQHRAVLSRLKNAPAAPTYLYYFDYESNILYPFSTLKVQYSFKGVNHCRDLPFLFSHFLANRISEDNPDYQNIKRMIGVWTKFATTGDPNDKDVKGMESLHWKPVKETEPAYKCLYIGKELEIKDWPDMEKLKGWENVYEKNKDLLY